MTQGVFKKNRLIVNMSKSQTTPIYTKTYSTWLFSLNFLA